MAEIIGPYEILELDDGESVTFHVVSYETGIMVIHPTYPGAPEEKVVDGLRVFVTLADKEYLPSYYDVTGGHLVAGLKPLLDMLVETKKAVTITAKLMRPGRPASKRHKIEIEE